MKTKQEIINQFKSLPLSEQKKIIRNTEKRWQAIKNKNKLTNPVENYHYFTCPISNAKHCSYGKPYYDRFSTTEEEFKQAFPEIDTLYQTPYQTEQKPKNEKEINNLEINDITIHDIDTVINKAKKSETEAIRKLCNNHNLNKEDLKEGLHYWLCPITKTKVLRMNKNYFNKFNVTKEQFMIMFPEVDVDSMQYNPFVDKAKINAKTDPKPTESSLKDESWKTRNSHLTRTEMASLKDSDDPDIKLYMDKVEAKSTEAINKVMNDTGLSVDELNPWEHFLIHPLTGGFTHKLNNLSPFGITQDAFLREFPEYKGRLSSTYTVAKSEKALNEVDETTGKTKREMITEKRTGKMKEVNPESGKTYQEEATEKTKNSHLNRIDEYGRNGYQRLADENHGKRIMTRMAKNEVDASTDPFVRYKRIVEFMRNKMDNFLKLCYPGKWVTFNSNNSEIGFNADHCFSRAEGYRQEISPLCIGNLLNVEVMQHAANVRKGDKCSISIDILSQRVGMSYDQMRLEFHAIMKVINEDIQNNEVHNTMSVLIRASKHAGYDVAMKLKDYYWMDRDPQGYLDDLMK